MKNALLALPMLLIVPTVQAYEAVARVVNVTPVTETVSRPTQKCWTETREVTRAPERDYGGAVIGTIAGGLIGSQIGKGRGKLVGAAAGAGIGAMIGDSIANQDAVASTATVPVQRCHTVNHVETRVAGYRVTYEYDNWRFTTRMPYHPGNELRVNVAVTPK